MKKNNQLQLAVLCLLMILTLNVYATLPSDDYSSDNKIQSDYWNAKFDGAGFGDEFYWGNSPYHPHSSHELLSGEWAAAIYYDGISTSPNAMWLTDEFIYPDWTTESDFIMDTMFSRWDDTYNP